MVIAVGICPYVGCGWSIDELILFLIDFLYHFVIAASM
jgi:hypothetical protein